MGFVRDLPTKTELARVARKLGEFTERELRKAAPRIGLGQVRDYLRICTIIGYGVGDKGRPVNRYRAPDAQSENRDNQPRPVRD